jgi:hypothetical protein
MMTGRSVFLANLSFTFNLRNVSGRRFGECCVEVTADSVMQSTCSFFFHYASSIYSHTNQVFFSLMSTGEKWDMKAITYFPELSVAKWFREKEKKEVPVYTFQRVGNSSPSSLCSLYVSQTDCVCYDICFFFFMQ